MAAPSSGSCDHDDLQFPFTAQHVYADVVLMSDKLKIGARVADLQAVEPQVSERLGQMRPRELNLTFEAIDLHAEARLQEQKDGRGGQGLRGAGNRTEDRPLARLLRKAAEQLRQPSRNVSMEVRGNGEVEDLRYATTVSKMTQIARLPHEPPCGLRFGELQVAQKTDRIDSPLTWYTVCGSMLSSIGQWVVAKKSLAKRETALIDGVLIKGAHLQDLALLR
jgi:hypothetical protein